MVKPYHVLHHWNHWLIEPAGVYVLKNEQKFLSSLLAKYDSKKILLIGVPEQHKLIHARPETNAIVLSPLTTKIKNIKYIEGEYTELPILSGSLDLVILPHTLDFITNPRALLTEACRVVKPEGEIMIFGFNPISLWGIQKWLRKNKNIPWSGNFIRAFTVKKWLSLADFEFVQHDAMLFWPLFFHNIFHKHRFIDWLCHHCYVSFGGVYIITAKAKLIPLTPIRLHWQQSVTRASITIPRPLTRGMK